MKENYFQDNMQLKEETVPLQKGAELEHSINLSREGNPEVDAEDEKLVSQVEKKNELERIKVMEVARSERLGILGGVFSRLKASVEASKEKIGINKLKEKIDSKLPRPAQELISQMMDASSIKMYTEAVIGKNLMGKKLGPKDRILAVLSAGTNDIAKCLFTYAASSGSVEYAQLGGVAYGTSWALLLIKNGSRMMQNLKELANYYGFTDISPVLIKTEEAFDKYGYPDIEEKLEPISN